MAGDAIPRLMFGILVKSYRYGAMIRTNTFGAPGILWLIGKLACEIWGFPQIRARIMANTSGTPHSPTGIGKARGLASSKESSRVVPCHGPVRASAPLRPLPPGRLPRRDVGARIEGNGRSRRLICPVTATWLWEAIVPENLAHGQFAGSCFNRRIHAIARTEQYLDGCRVACGQRFAQQTQQAKMLARRLVAKGILTRWQAGQLLVGWHKLRLGNYRLCSQIGRSETGRVFLAEHTELRREVAIKTLSRRFTQHREVVERFLEDAREVAALDHRNIRHVFDVDNADDQFFLVMEYVNGTDLQRLVEQQGPLPVNTAAEYVRQAADGLAHAHALGITHRDLCPSNLMVDDKQVVKIVGMGMGRLAEHHADEKAGDDSSRRGSGYIPPEVAHGTGPFDGRSDIYALGCAAYYLLTGCAPQSDASQSDASQSDASQSGASQSGASSGELSAAEDNALPVDIGELRSDAPPSLVAIVRRMMASVPDERFPTAADVSLALQTWLGADPLERVLPGIPVAAPASEPFEWVPQEPAAAPGSQPDDPPAEEAQEPTVEATERWWETDEWKKWLIVVVVLQVLVFIAAFAMSSWFARRPPDSQSAPMQIMERSQLENDLPDLSDGPQRQVAQAGEVLCA